MSDTQQINTDSISDWSKWVIGLSLFSASGCVGVLLTTGVKRANILNIKLAILFFLATILIAWIVQFFIAVAKSYSENKVENEIINVSYKTVRKWLKPLIIIEITTFTLSLLFLTIWIMKLPAKDIISPTEQITPSHSFNEQQSDNLISKTTSFNLSNVTTAKTNCSNIYFSTRVRRK